MPILPEDHFDGLAGKIKIFSGEDFNSTWPNLKKIETPEEIIKRSTWKKYYRRGNKYFFRNDKCQSMSLKLEANQELQDFLNTSVVLLELAEKTRNDINRSLFL